MRASVSLFQSTLPREERQCIICIIIFIQYQFQSTLPREERPETKSSSLSKVVLISIHAPTRGATKLGGLHAVWWAYFNPRSHERSDAVTLRHHEGKNISIHAPTRGATNTRYNHTYQFLFQSTLPREERPEFKSPLDTLKDFNPRSHERSDIVK